MVPALVLVRLVLIADRGAKQFVERHHREGGQVSEGSSFAHPPCVDAVSRRRLSTRPRHGVAWFAALTGIVAAIGSGRLFQHMGLGDALAGAASNLYDCGQRGAAIQSTWPRGPCTMWPILRSR
jgi:hypothetical protein